MKYCELVNQAVSDANEENYSGLTDKKKNQMRSSNFVKHLSAGLRAKYLFNQDVRVLSKDFGNNRVEFGLNELMFDILVCEVTQLLSANKTKEIVCVTSGMLAVESEMARDSRQAIYDFNKLVLSSCTSKLFVGPIVADIDAYIDTLSSAARFCKGELSLALICHPSKWKKSGPELGRFWSWNGSDWIPE